jgi:hypothetical protein
VISWFPALDMKLERNFTITYDELEEIYFSLRRLQVRLQCRDVVWFFLRSCVLEKYVHNAINAVPKIY